MVAGMRRELAFPLRWFSIPNVFRYERPQKGRLREHFQLNVDTFDIPYPYGEMEMIIIASEIMKKFGIEEQNFEIKISSRRLINTIMKDWYELDEFKGIILQKLIDNKNKISKV
jgi:histidyl-tRNA synthetase